MLNLHPCPIHYQGLFDFQVEGPVWILFSFCQFLRIWLLDTTSKIARALQRE
jgi:hypothetical protein